MSYARSNGAARATYPSRWLLELASRLEGKAVYASDVARLVATGRPWLVWLASAHDALTRVTRALAAEEDGRSLQPAGLQDRVTAGSLADLRLAAALTWKAGGRRPGAASARRAPGAAAGSRAAALRARRSRAFTPYDGNLGELAGASS